MTHSQEAPQPSPDQPLLVLVNFGLADAEREMIEAVDPRIRVELALRKVPGAAPGPGGWSSAPADWERRPDEEIEAIVAQAEILFTFRFPPRWLDIGSNLRWLQLNSAGADYIIHGGVYEKRPGMLVTTVSGIHEIPISEHVLGNMLYFSRGFGTAVRAQQKGEWNRYPPQELAGKTVGIFGYGPIARRVAMLSSAFGMRVLVTRRTPAEPDGVVERYYSNAELHGMLPECDFLVIAAPLTAETRHVIGRAELGLLKSSAVIVNIARGPLIDEQALIEWLSEGRIAGAGLDVFEQEPLPSDSPLWSLPNVLLTPHIAGSSPLYNRRASEVFCANLRAYLAGEPLRNLVDPARGY